MEKRKTFLISTLACLLFSMQVLAQSFEFQYQGKTILNEGTVTIPAVEDEYGFGEMWCESNPSSHPDDGLILKLLSGTTASVSATLTIEHNTLNPGVLKWCMGGDCVYVGRQTTLNKNFIVNGGREQVQFDAENIQSEGYLLATLSATIAGETHSVKIRFINGSGDDGPNGDIWGYITDESPYGMWYKCCGAAIFIPADDTMLGAQITAIRIPYWGEMTDKEKLPDVTVWLAESLDGYSYVREMRLVDGLTGLDEENFSGFVELSLDEPYTVTSRGIYVGVLCPDGLFILRHEAEATKYGCYYKEWNTENVEDESWIEGSSYRWSLQVRVSGHHIPQVKAQFGTTKQSTTQAGKTAISRFKLLNDGLYPIKNIDYTIWINGKSESRHLTVDVPSGILQSALADIEITAPTGVAAYEVKLRVDKVNGIDNPSRDIISSVTMQNLATDVDRTVLMEEATGAWCGWCVRGIVGMKQAKERYGDRFIGIAVHGGDVMDIGTYYPLGLGGYPSCRINRDGEKYDPYDDTATIESAMKLPPSAGVSVSGVWNAARTEVKATSEILFLAEGTGMRVAYVLVADGLTGTSDEWTQNNYYVGNTSEDPDLQYYSTQPWQMKQTVFNDVVVASSYNKYKNLAPTFTGTPKVGEKQTNSYTIALPTEGELAEAIDKDQVYIVAIVTNADGTIANAAKAKVHVPVTYTLTYMLDGETYKSYEVLEGTEIIPELAPKREGYTFDGWEGLPEVMPDHDITVTGSFTMIPTTIDVAFSAAGYATFYDSQTPYVLSSGLKAYVAQGMSDGKLEYSLIADGDDTGAKVLPAGVAVVLEAKVKKTKYTLVEDVSKTPAPAYTDANLLRGSDVTTITSASSTSLFYKLAYGNAGTYQADVFGWFWGAADGAAFSIEGHRAWLAVPRTAAKGKYFFALPGDMIDIESDNNDKAQNMIFDLQGRRVSSPVRGGLYIINGKLQLIQ